MDYFTKEKIVYLKLLLATLFFAVNYIAGRVMSTSLSPYTSAFLRFFTASIFLTYIIYRKFGKFPRIDFSQFLLIIGIGLTGIVGFNLFFFQGLKYIPASRASIIVSLNPTVIIILSGIILKEKITLSKAIGIVLSWLGAIIVISRGNLIKVFTEKIGVGELILFGCIICWAIFSVLGKISVKSLKPIIAVTYGCIVGTIILFFPALAMGELQYFWGFSFAIWLSVFELGFLGTAVAFNWFYEAIEEIGPSRSGIFFNFLPVFTTLLAVMILHEQIYASLVLGAVLVISGVYLANSRFNENKKKIEVTNE